MASAATVSMEDYLASSFEGVDVEYVDGRIVQRDTPDLFHMRVQQRLAEIFGALRKKRGVEPGVELRLRLASDRVRIPDYSVFREPQTERFPSHPPWIAVEVVSEEDRYSEVVEKLREYRDWGVEHVWLIDPYHQAELSVYGDRGLRSVERFEVQGGLPLRIGVAELFE